MQPYTRFTQLQQQQAAMQARYSRRLEQQLSQYKTGILVGYNLSTHAPILQDAAGGTYNAKTLSNSSLTQGAATPLFAVDKTGAYINSR
jgi:hypothetical protein